MPKPVLLPPTKLTPEEVTRRLLRPVLKDRDKKASHGTEIKQSNNRGLLRCQAKERKSP